VIALLGIAFAGDAYLAGGLSATPTVGSLVAPTWRLGWANDRVTLWGSAAWASFGLDLGRQSEPSALSGFVLRPRVGGRYQFSDRGADRVATYVGASTATALFGLAADNDDDEVFESEELDGRLPLAVTGAFGLQAGLTDALGVSVEVGADWESARYVERGNRVSAFGAFTTYAGFTLDLFL
jgi:hypothetical protein